MAPTTTNPQLPSKISRLPEEILYQNFNQGSQGTFLRSGMRTYEFQIAKTNLEDRVAQFRFLFDRSLKDFPRPNEEEILKKMFERKCIELVRSSCAQEFLEIHGRQLATIQTFEKAIELIAGIFGEESEEERKGNAQIELEKLARDIDKGEKFSAFLQRIKALAEIIDNRPVAVDFMTEMKFKKCIEPCNLTFLQDNCQHKGSAESIAKFLDERNRFKLVKVAQTEALDLRAFMTEQSELLRSLIKEDRREFEKLNASKNAEFSSAIESLTATVNELKMERARSQAPAQNQNFPQFGAQTFSPNRAPNVPWQQIMQNTQQGQGPFQGGQTGQPWIQSQYPKAPYCSQCGKYGHTKRRCREVRCFKCQGLGHVLRDCNKPDTPARAQIPELARNLQGLQQVQNSQQRNNAPNFSGNL